MVIIWGFFSVRYIVLSLGSSLELRLIDLVRCFVDAFSNAKVKLWDRLEESDIRIGWIQTKWVGNVWTCCN